MTKIRSTVTALMVTAGLTLTSAGGAAAATCYRNNCDGRSPSTTGCDADAYTLRSSKIYNSSGVLIATVELRYSGTCAAVWSRVTSQSGTRPLVARASRGSLNYSSTVTGTRVFSRMVGDLPGSVCAYGRAYYANGSGSWPAKTVCD